MKTICIILFAFFLTNVSFSQSKSVIKCSIWKPTSFCNIPDSLNLPSWRADNLTIESVQCEQLDKKNNLIGVWIKLSKKDGSSFLLESNFKNISLVKKNNQEKISPEAILWNLAYSDKHGYISSNFKTNSFKAKFGTHKNIDLIIIFTNAEKGDKIIIDNFVEAEIQ